MSERHRHRYEFNPRFRSRFDETDFVCSGSSPDGRLVEFIELATHPFWVGTQAHPEFKSRPNRPAPAVPRAHRRRAGPGRGSQPAHHPARARARRLLREPTRRRVRPRRPSARSTSGQRDPASSSAPSRRPTARPSSATSSTTPARWRWCRCSTTAGWRWSASTAPPLDRLLLEIPAGIRDVAGEPPEQTARRASWPRRSGLEAAIGSSCCARSTTRPAAATSGTSIYLATGLRRRRQRRARASRSST